MLEEVYSKAVRKRIDALEEKKRLLLVRVRDIERQIEDEMVGQSPITVNDRIQWGVNGKTRYGRVVAIRVAYRGFEYRVVVTTRDGARDIGTATVGPDQQPQLVDGE